MPSPSDYTQIVTNFIDINDMTAQPVPTRSPSPDPEPEPEPRDPEVPAMEDFTVIKMLGQGGFGIV